MWRAVFLLIAGAVCTPAQFRTIEMKLEGVGCASCLDSLPDRLRRLRGIESAEVDKATGTLRVKLADRNRLRVEQVRDMAEQDGTKARHAVVEVTGRVSHVDGRPVLEFEGSTARYQLNGRIPGGESGTWLIRGDIRELHPESGLIVIRIRDARQTRRPGSEVTAASL